MKYNTRANYVAKMGNTKKIIHALILYILTKQSIDTDPANKESIYIKDDPDLKVIKLVSISMSHSKTNKNTSKISKIKKEKAENNHNDPRSNKLKVSHRDPRSDKQNNDDD